jgi:hypothetical protein
LDHDAGVVQQPVEEADGGGVLGRKRPQDSNGQWLAMPRERRSWAAETTRNSSWDPVSPSGAKPTSPARSRSLRSRPSMTLPTELSARPP